MILSGLNEMRNKAFTFFTLLEHKTLLFQNLCNIWTLRDQQKRTVCFSPHNVPIEYLQYIKHKKKLIRIANLFIA